jgi:hypothetical protein
MPSAEFYRRKADEYVVAAKAATLNKERARYYALAEHYVRFAMDELKRDPKPNGLVPFHNGTL